MRIARATECLVAESRWAIRGRRWTRWYDQTQHPAPGEIMNKGKAPLRLPIEVSNSAFTLLHTVLKVVQIADDSIVQGQNLRIMKKHLNFSSIDVHWHPLECMLHSIQRLGTRFQTRA